MADGFKVQLDHSEWDKVFTALDGPVKESLSRRMLVEGGVLLRDKTKSAAPLSDGPYSSTSRGSHKSGTLRDSIYLAKDSADTTDTLIVYKISWNNKKAWWGRLVEFGWWQTHEIHRASNGEFFTDMKKPLPAPIWHGPKSFMRPTIDTYRTAAINAMIDRGRRELPILLGEL